MRSPLISAVVATCMLLSTTAAAARQPDPIAARSGTEIEGEEIRGAFMIIGIIVVLLLIGGLVILDDDDEADSP